MSLCVLFHDVTSNLLPSLSTSRPQSSLSLLTFSDSALITKSSLPMPPLSLEEFWSSNNLDNYIDKNQEDEVWGKCVCCVFQGGPAALRLAAIQ